jgi:integrase
VSSVHRITRSPYWVCFYTDHTGRRRAKSTGTDNRRDAVRVCNEVQALEDKARAGGLTAENAQRVITSKVAELMELQGTPLPQGTIREHFESWFAAFEGERKSGTVERYRTVKNRFLKWLGARADKPLPTLRPTDVQAYRDAIAPELSGSTVNTHLKVLRVCLKRAVKLGVFERNPASVVDNLDAGDRHKRRPFTLAELRKILGTASADWKTAVLFGLYTGLRLSDIAGLTWANLDLESGELTVKTQKTGRVQILPLAGPLAAHIATLRGSDDPKAPLTPSLHDRNVSGLSNEFFELMANVGLVESRGEHRAKKEGRSQRRQQSELTFHSLRHTATSLLKRAGVSAAVVMDIIGHESEAISQNYTHVDSDTKRAALEKLPDLT